MQRTWSLAYYRHVFSPYKVSSQWSVAPVNMPLIDVSLQPSQSSLHKPNGTWPAGYTHIAVIKYMTWPRPVPLGQFASSNGLVVKCSHRALREAMARITADSHLHLWETNKQQTKNKQNKTTTTKKHKQTNKTKQNNNNNKNGMLVVVLSGVWCHSVSAASWQRFRILWQSWSVTSISVSAAAREIISAYPSLRYALHLVAGRWSNQGANGRSNRPSLWAHCYKDVVDWLHSSIIHPGRGRNFRHSRTRPKDYYTVTISVTCRPPSVESVTRCKHFM